MRWPTSASPTGATASPARLCASLPPDRIRRCRSTCGPSRATTPRRCCSPAIPLRARWIADTFLESPRQVNGERGLLGFTGSVDGTPVSVQATGMGCPSAAIVIEELIQLGCTRLIRVGTCGALQPQLALGDMIVGISAVPADGTARAYTGGEPHAPTADFGLTHGIIHAAKGFGVRPHVGAIASSDTFYDPDPRAAQALGRTRACWPSRWRPRCCLPSAACARCRRRVF